MRLASLITSSNMKKLKLTFTLSAILSTSCIIAQPYLGYINSNYSGVTSVLVNPANAVDGRVYFDMNLAGVNIDFGNNYIGMKHSVFNGYGMFDFNNPNFKDNQFQTKFLTAQNNGKDKSAYLGTRITLPSFLVHIDRKNAIAFNWNIRTYANVDNVNQDLATLIYKELKYPSLFIPDNAYNIGVNANAWMEYGLTYARVLKDDNEHFFKAGATVKILQGLVSGYAHADQLHYQFTSDSTLTLQNSYLSYGHSNNFEADANGIKLNKFTSYPGIGFDIGGVYEWRPQEKDYRYNLDGENNLLRRDKEKYKLKISASIVDIGGIRYDKSSLSNNFIANASNWKIKKIDLGSSHPIKTLDDTLKLRYGNADPSKTFKVPLPTAIYIQADYNIYKWFYANMTSKIAFLYNKREAKTHEFTNISIAPRFESKFLCVSIPVSYNQLLAQAGEPILMGAMLQLGWIVVGTNNLNAFLFKSQDIYGADFYALFKFPLYYHAPRDKDKDGISDKKDKCPTVPGTWEFMGCADRDGDHIQDSEDKCPDVPGVKELQGCPDKDGDGITDAEDACPDEKGLPEFKGCPDRDKDGIMDKEDECPDEPGLKEFMGCPDKDGDGIPDKFDACPDVPGPKEYKGCPDKDGDGTLDKDDACPDVPGPKENKGCPWPDTDKDGIVDKDDACPTVPGVPELKGCPPAPKLTEKEEKIIQKAFDNLEFATGKDIIKPVSFPALNDLAKLMKQHADWTLTLSGHTDNQGDPQKNLLLSEKRANSVKRYLVSKGATATNIITEWFGDTKPIADNNTPEGRQKNRRVEMKIQYKEKK